MPNDKPKAGCAPTGLPMVQRDLLLRVYSVRRISEEPGAQQDPTEEPGAQQDPTEGVWEVRARTDVGERSQASIFYTEIHPCNLPPMASVLQVTVDDQQSLDEQRRPRAGEIVLDAEAALAEEDK